MYIVCYVSLASRACSERSNNVDNTWILVLVLVFLVREISIIADQESYQKVCYLMFPCVKLIKQMWTIGVYLRSWGIVEHVATGKMIEVWSLRISVDAAVT